MFLHTESEKDIDMKARILLLALVALTMCSLTANAEKAKINGLWYDLIDRTKEATLFHWEENEHSVPYSGDIVIPATVKYEGVEYNVTRIGSAAFHYCGNLTSVTIPNSVTSVGSIAFLYCSGLTSVSIPNSVTSIENGAFYGCSGLTSVTISNNVTSIGDNAFYGCRGLTTVTIPNSVTNLGNGAFYGCSGLTSVTISNNVTSIGGNAFYGCSDLTTVTIPNSVTIIGKGAFYSCSGLTSVDISNNVTSIGDDAFYGCSGLTTVTIPNSVTSIGNGAFDSCSGLTCIVVEDGNTIYDSRDNCNAIIKTSTNELIKGCNNTIIPNSVTIIGDYAFMDCNGLNSVAISSNVTSIGEGAFYDSWGLTSVTIPNSVTDIGNYAFFQCVSLTSVNISNNVTSIGEGVFCCCSGLTTVTIPGTVTSIGEGAFDDCNLESVISLIEEPFAINGKAEKYKRTFSLNTFVNAILYVPAGTIDKYKMTEGWKDFENIVEFDATEVTEVKTKPVLIQSEGNTLTINGTSEGTPINVYDFGGKLIGNSTATEGTTKVQTRTNEKVVIVKVGKRSVKVMR